MINAIVVHSGGLDSTVLLYEMLRDFEVTASVGVDYGQRHAKELSAAFMLCSKLGIPRRTIDLEALGHWFTNSSQTGTVNVPHGHYSADNMKITIVPNRNMILLAIAAGMAVNDEVPIIGYGAHAGDHAIYPDCREEFVESINICLDAANDYKVKVYSPFIQMTKAQIVARGLELGVPFEDTWTCYEGGDISCGRCGTCVERLEAFDIAGASDPLEYADREFYKGATKVNIV